MKTLHSFLTGFLVISAVAWQIMYAAPGASAQKSPDSLSLGTQPNKNYERHYFDLGVGFGLDYGGQIGAKFAWLVIPNLSVFLAGGYYLYGFGWSTGVTWHILPCTSRYSVRPNIKLMYGVNGGSTVSGTSAYNTMFYGVTPGFGLEFMFGRHKKNGLDLDVNVPLHGEDFFSQINMMKNDKSLSNVKTPWPVVFSLGFHHEF